MNGRHRAVALGGFVALDVGLTLVGDTPDTRDTAVEMAAFFVERRAPVLAGAVLLTAATWAFTATVLRTATIVARTGRTLAARTITVAGATAAVLLLLTVVLPLSSLAYVVANTDPAAVRPMFLTTLAAAPLLAWPLTVLFITTGIVSWHGTKVQQGLAAVQLLVGGVVALGVAAYADRGYFSPDVQQQIAITSLAIWLLTTAAERGPSSSRHRLGAASSRASSSTQPNAAVRTAVRHAACADARESVGA